MHDGDAEGDALLQALRRVTPNERVLGRIRSTVLVDGGHGRSWTIDLHHGHPVPRRGSPRKPDTTVRATPETLLDLVEGRRSGVEAFLAGDLRIRGNLALALALDSLFERPGRPLRFPKARRAKAGAIDTFYLDAGAGPTIVALHGLGATNASMLPTVWALADRFRVLAPDLPGHGDTDKPISSYDARFFEHWLASFLDGVGIERAHLVGNSLGGRIAIEMALHRPDRVGRLGLLAPSMAFRQFRELVPLARAAMPELGAFPIRVPRGRIEQGVRLLFSRSERVDAAWHDAAADEFLRVFSSARGRIAFFAAARQIYLETPFGEEGFWSRLESLANTVLCIWGENDWLVPAKFARHVATVLPRVRNIIFPDCGHVPQFEWPEKTHAILREFFEESPTPRGPTIPPPS